MKNIFFLVTLVVLFEVLIAQSFKAEKAYFKKFLSEIVKEFSTISKHEQYQQTVRTMPEYAYAVYLIVADDDNSNNFAWDISTPYVPDYLTNININLYSLGMISPTMCFDTACGGFLSCCGNSSYSNMLTPPSSLIYLSQNRGSAKGQIPDSAVVLWTLGGEVVSDDSTLWTWLEDGDESTMQAYAQGVANWQQYGVDGINLDIEENAGGNLQLCQNLVKWVEMIKELWPSCIIGATAYSGGEYGRYSQNLLSVSGYLDFIQIMTYSVSADEALTSSGKLICGSDNTWPCTYNSTTSIDNYNTCVKNNQVQNCFQGLGTKKLLLGTAGGSTQVVLSTAQLVTENNLGGLMIWCSVVCAKSISVYESGATQSCSTPCTTCQTPVAWNVTGVNTVDYCPCSTTSCCSVCDNMCFGPYYAGMNMAEYANILSTNASVNDYLAASNLLTAASTTSITIEIIDN